MKSCPYSIAAGALVALLASAPDARANGRFPESNQILFSEHDPDLVFLRVTFGLLISHDHGKTFHWACEQSIGFSGNEDPMYAVTPSSAYVGSTFEGIAVSRDKGCNWSKVGGDLAEQVFIDLSANPNDAKDIVVFASSYDKQDDAGNSSFASKVWETKDEARTFQQLGDRLDPALLGYTIDLTKSDPDRIYITAVRDAGTSPSGVLLVSKDHGKTWTEEAVPLVNGERAVYIAAVDPLDAERVYLRTAGPPTTPKPTRLLLREAPEGGAPTQRTLYQASGALPGFALTPDGSKVYIGGPKDGVRVASTTDYVFQQRSTLEAQCLAVSADGLWACSNERSGFIAGLSKDDGVTFEPVLRFCDIGGPLSACEPTSMTTQRCGPGWPVQKATLGCGARPETDAGFFDAGDFPPPPPPPKGCDCHASPAGPWGALVAAFGAALALVRRSRRRAD